MRLGRVAFERVAFQTESMAASLATAIARYGGAPVLPFQSSQAHLHPLLQVL